MGSAFYKYQELREKYLENEHCTRYRIRTDAERIVECISGAGLSLVVLATFAHRTKLEANGTVKVHFTESFSVDLKEETTTDALLQDLAGQLISLNKDQKWGKLRRISGSSGISLDDDAKRQALEGFLADPMSAVPDELKDTVTQGLAKKAKSINKHIRNYDNEVTRRARGRKSRAVTSLTNVLAELDTELRLTVINAIRLNKTVTDQYGRHSRKSSLRKLHAALSVVLSGNNLKNWQDEDVISEATRLVNVQVVMDQ